MGVTGSQQLPMAALTAADAAEAGACVRSYIRAWNAQDFTAMAGHFTEPCVFMLESGSTLLPTRDAAVAFLRGIFEALRADAFDHSEIGAIHVRRCSASLLVAEVDDIRRFRRDGSAMGTIEVQYTLRREADGHLRIAAALWCEPGWRLPVMPA